MATIEVVVCDVCRNPERGTTQFQAAEGVEAAVLLELCRDHAAPLRELLKRGTVALARGTATKVAQARVPTARKTPARRRRTGFDSAVSTMDEIEAGKQG